MSEIKLDIFRFVKQLRLTHKRSESACLEGDFLTVHYLFQILISTNTFYPRLWIILIIVQQREASHMICLHASPEILPAQFSIVRNELNLKGVCVLRNPLQKALAFLSHLL